MRLDLFLTKYHNIQSRNKASELIKDKKVFVDGQIILKPSFKVLDTHNITIKEENFYVSRAAYKLKYFLEENDINISNLEALDIGSSTGGFTQILLQNNIKTVTCVDVGSNQLHSSIKNDPRIIVKENTDIRDFHPNNQYDLVTCDVSFISILMILDDIARLSKDKIIILYKPQFEVGKNIKRDSKGVVLDKKAIEDARANFLQYTSKLNWQLILSNKSKLAGKEGNVEEIFYFTT